MLILLWAVLSSTGHRAPKDTSFFAISFTLIHLPLLILPTQVGSILGFAIFIIPYSSNF